jgi:hypothetical protein
MRVSIARCEAGRSPTRVPSLPSRIRRRRWASRCPCSRDSIALRRRLERSVRGACTTRLQARRRPGLAAPMPQAHRRRGPRIPTGSRCTLFSGMTSEHRPAPFIPRLRASSPCKSPPIGGPWRILQRNTGFEPATYASAIRDPRTSKLHKRPLCFQALDFVWDRLNRLPIGRRPSAKRAAAGPQPAQRFDQPVVSSELSPPKDEGPAPREFFEGTGPFAVVAGAGFEPATFGL